MLIPRNLLLSLMVGCASFVHAQPALQRNLICFTPQPISMVQAPQDDLRYFVIRKTNGTSGDVNIVKNGVLSSIPFLTVSPVSTGGEQGLLGLAFHPNYPLNGYFFVNYTKPDGTTVISRFSVDPGNPDQALPNSEYKILEVAQPFANHNGGTMRFGADGYLYIGMGDGGSGGDPGNRAQNLNELLGKMLRLNVDVDEFPADPNRNYGIPSDNPFASGGGAPEIWGYGLRNPWKFAFDKPSSNGFGGLMIADVGESTIEEVNYVPPGLSGLNFGWRVKEGTMLTGNGGGTGPFFDPIYEYTHDDGCSVTGGAIYRGTKLGPDYWGRYFFGDWCNAWIDTFPMTFDLETGAATRGAPVRSAVPPTFGLNGIDPNNKGELFTFYSGNFNFYELATASNYPSISGVIERENLVGPYQPLGINVRYLDPDNGTVLKELQVGLPTFGEYRIPAYPVRSLMQVQGGSWLSQTIEVNNTGNVSLSGINFSLKNGDVDGDNEVGPGDFSLLAGAFGQTMGDAGYSRQADLDRDGEIGPSDFAILATNFGETGS